MTRPPKEQIIDAVNASTHVHARDIARVEAAIRRDALHHDGMVNPNRVRAALSKGGVLVVYPRVVGAVYSKLAKAGILVTAGTATSTDVQGGNNGKPIRVYRVTDLRWLTTGERSPEAPPAPKVKPVPARAEQEPLPLEGIA